MYYQALSKAIADGLPSLSPQLQMAARHVLDRLDDVALISVRGLAPNAGDHPTIMARLARRFGFDSFNEFLTLFEKRLRGHSSDYTRRAKDLQSRAGRLPVLVTEVMERGLSNLRDSFEINGTDRFVPAADEILGAKRIFVACLRSCHPAAFYFHYVCQVFRDNGVLLHSQGSTFNDELRHFTKSDVLLAISVQPYTRETVAAAEFAHSRSCSTVVVTDNLVSPLSRNADRILLIETEAPSIFSLRGSRMSVMEALVALMLARGGCQALDATSESENQLKQSNPYWQSAQHPVERQSDGRWEGVRS